MPIPMYGVYLVEELKNKTISPTPSSHPVKRFIARQQTGKTFRGYFKPCDPSYPPKLALFNMAFSVHMRMAIGDRAAEELPVYDDAGVFIGTFSVEIPNFRAMLAIGDAVPLDDDERDHVCPDEEKLIAYNVAELLIARWRRKDDDTHPGNLGLQSTIDYEMMEYQITSELKGERRIAGIFVPWPNQAFPLTVNDIKNFPELTDAKPCFWPTKSPENFNLYKDYRNKEEFLKLKNNREFIRQKYFALLKELLSYDEIVLRQRLSLYIQDGEFIDECILFFRHEHNEFYQVLLSSPEFIRFLRTQPGVLDQVLNWFVEDNKHTSTPTYAHNIERIKASFLSVWQDCFVNNFYMLMNNLSRLTLGIMGDPYLEARQEIREGPGAADVQIDALLQTTASFNSDSQASEYSRSLNVREFYQQLRAIILDFYHQKSGWLSDHQQFLATLRGMVEQSTQVREGIPVRNHELWDKLISNMSILIASMELNAETKRSLSDTDDFIILPSVTVPVQPASISSIPFIKPHASQREQNIAAGKLLYQWIIEQDKGVIRNVIEEAKALYQPFLAKTRFSFLNPFTFTKTHGEDIDELLKKISSATSPIDLLCQITASGGWNENSFNTKLMRVLCKYMAVDYSHSMDKLVQYGNRQQLLKMHTALSDIAMRDIREQLQIEMHIAFRRHMTSAQPA